MGLSFTGGHVSILKVLKGDAGPHPQGGQGFIWHGIARGPTSVALTAFFNPYITTIAKFAAASSKNGSKLRVNWLGIPMLATSYVGVYSSVFTILAAICAPFLGSVSDLAGIRKKYMLIFSYTMIIALFLMILLTRSLWWLGGLLGGAVLFSYEAILVFLYAYLPEIGDDYTSRSKYSTYQLVFTNLSQLIFAVACSVILAILSPTLELKDTDFTSDISSWQYRVVNSSTPCSPFTCNFDTFEACSPTSSVCRLLDSNIQFRTETDPLESSLYQVSSQDPNVFRDKSILFQLSLEQVQTTSSFVRIWQDDVGRSSSLVSGNTDELDNVFLLSNIGTSVRNLSFEAVIASSNDNPVIVKSISLDTEPSIAIPLSMVVCGLWYWVFNMFTLTNLRNNQVLKPIENSNNIFLSSFKSIYETIKDMRMNSPVVLLYLLGYSFYSSGAAAVVSVAGVVFQEELGLSPSMVGVAIIATQLFGILGAYIAHVLVRRLGSSGILVYQYALFIISVLYISVFITGGSVNIVEMIVMTFLFGISLGGSISQSRSSFSNMIPKGSEAEYMGLYNFSSKWISWLGTVLYTAVNEGSGSVRYAFLSIGSLFVVALGFQLAVTFMFKPPEQEEEEELKLESFR